MNRIIYAIVALVALVPLPALAQDGTPPETDIFSSLMRSILNMPTIALYVGLIVIAGPYLIAAFNRAKWSSTTKFIVTVVACVVFSAGWFVANGDIIPVGKWVRLALVIFYGATIMYRLMKSSVKEVEVKTG
jgi:hypothetical protein